MNETATMGRIEALVKRLDGVRICDDCITDRLMLSARSEADLVTRTIGGQQGFERQKGACGFCGSNKTVILHRVQ